MPVHPCQEDGKPGAKWGNSGKCYTYGSGTGRSRGEAIQAAIRQGRAAGATGDELRVVGFTDILEVAVDLADRGSVVRVDGLELEVRIERGDG